MLAHKFSSVWTTLAAVTSLAGAIPGQSPEESRPSLIVVVSIDQMSRWLLDETLPFLADSGIKRLMREGVDFSACAYKHANTETGPGHATIGTGAPCAVHGIIANDWYDRETLQLTYCASDPHARPVGYEASLAHGPARLLVPTLGESLKEQLGAECKVFSFSWKNRSAVLMAGARANLAAWMDFADGDFVSSTSYVEELPGWLEEFNAAGRVEGYFGRTWERDQNDAAFDGLQDERKWEGMDWDLRRSFPHRIDGGLQEPGPRFYDHIYKSPFGDQVLSDLAKTAIIEEELGKDEHPDLLYLSFSANDEVGHIFGPLSWEVRDIYLKVDRQIGDLLAFLDEHVGEGRYAMMLSSDHGIGPIPEYLRAAGENAGREPLLMQKIFRVADTAMRRKYGLPPEGERYWATPSSEWGVHLNLPALASREIAKSEAAAVVAGALDKLIETSRVAVADQLRDDEEDPLLIALAEGHNPARSGDVLYLARKHWIASTSRATHGSAYDYDRRVPLLIMGPGIPAGLVLEELASPGMIASVAARLLGIQAPAGAGEAPPDSLQLR
ncbi:MAG: alkaline phosphatase family protein [Planctomycetota bacterium]